MPLFSNYAVIAMVRSFSTQFVLLSLALLSASGCGSGEREENLIAFWAAPHPGFYTLNMADGTTVKTFGDRDEFGVPSTINSVIVELPDGTVSHLEIGAQIERQTIVGLGVIEYDWPDSPEENLFLTVTPERSPIAVLAEIDPVLLEVVGYEFVLVEEASDLGALPLGDSSQYGQITVSCAGQPSGPGNGTNAYIGVTRNLLGQPGLNEVELAIWDGSTFSYQADLPEVDPLGNCSDLVFCQIGDMDALAVKALEVSLTALCASPAALIFPLIGTICCTGALVLAVVEPLFCGIEGEPGLCDAVDRVIEDFNNVATVEVRIYVDGKTPNYFSPERSDYRLNWLYANDPPPNFNFELTECDPAQIISTSIGPQQLNPCEGYEIQVEAYWPDPNDGTGTLIANIFRDGGYKETIEVGSLEYGTYTYNLNVSPGDDGKIDAIHLSILGESGEMVVGTTVEYTLQGCCGEMAEWCGNNVVLMTDVGKCGAIVILPVPPAAENCGDYTATNDFNGTGDASGYYPVGITVVLWTIIDLNGNINTCSHIVEIVDDAPPIIHDGGDITVEIPIPPPPNGPIADNGGDFLANAVTIGPGVHGVDTTSATTDGEPLDSCFCAQGPFCSGSNAIRNDVWYSFTASTNGVVEVSTCSQVNFDSIIAIYLGANGNPANAVACNDDGCNALDSSLTFQASAGQLYTVCIGSVLEDGGGMGSMEVTWLSYDDTCTGPPVSGMNVDWQSPTASDNCEGTVVNSSHAPGDFFEIGTTTVTLTASDFHGNVTSATFDVTVVENKCSP